MWSIKMVLLFTLLFFPLQNSWSSGKNNILFCELNTFYLNLLLRIKMLKSSMKIWQWRTKVTNENPLLKCNKMKNRICLQPNFSQSLLDLFRQNTWIDNQVLLFLFFYFFPNFMAVFKDALKNLLINNLIILRG